MDSDRSVDNNDVVCKVKNKKSSKTTFTTHKLTPHSSKHAYATSRFGSRSGDMKCYGTDVEKRDILQKTQFALKEDRCVRSVKRGNILQCVANHLWNLFAKKTVKKTLRQWSICWCSERFCISYVVWCWWCFSQWLWYIFYAHDDGDVCSDANHDEIYFDSEDGNDDEYYDAQDDHTHFTQADAQVGRTPGTQADVVDDIQGYENNFAFNIAHSAYLESVDLNVGAVPLSAIIDSGASINILDQETWEMLKKKNIKCTSQKTNRRKLFAYGHSREMDGLTECNVGGLQTSIHANSLTHGFHVGGSPTKCFIS